MARPLSVDVIWTVLAGLAVAAALGFFAAGDLLLASAPAVPAPAPKYDVAAAESELRAGDLANVFLKISQLQRPEISSGDQVQVGAQELGKTDLGKRE